MKKLMRDSRIKYICMISINCRRAVQVLRHESCVYVRIRYSTCTLPQTIATTQNQPTPKPQNFFRTKPTLSAPMIVPSQYAEPPPAAHFYITNNMDQPTQVCFQSKQTNNNMFSESINGRVQACCLNQSGRSGWCGFVAEETLHKYNPYV